MRVSTEIITFHPHSSGLISYDWLMRTISIEQLKTVLKDLPENPRVIVSGNFAMPKALMSAFDSQVPKYRLHMLNAPVGIPHRDGVTYESAFIGPGMRNSKQLTYIPCRLSLLPVLIKSHLKPDVVLIHTSLPRFDTVSDRKSVV